MMREMTSKYDEFLSRIYIIASKAGELEVFIDFTEDKERPTLYIEGTKDIDDEIYANILSVMKTCEYKVINKKRTKKKISIKLEIKNGGKSYKSS